MKKIIVLFFVLGVAFLNAQNIKINSNISEFQNNEYKTPHDKVVTINNSTQTILMTFEKDASAMVNGYLSKQEAIFLQNHKAVFIADISKMPSLITKFFALPKLKKFKHTIYLNYNEEFEDIAPHKEDRVTIIKLEDDKVKAIYFIKTSSELEKVFN